MLEASSVRTNWSAERTSCFSRDRSIIPCTVNVITMPRMTDSMLLMKLAVDSFMTVYS